MRYQMVVKKYLKACTTAHHPVGTKRVEDKKRLLTHQKYRAGESN